VKNTHRRGVRNRTTSSNRSGTPDRRVQKTRASLHDALITLAREKPYPAIAVKEILDRANVGRSTFYTHYRDKNDLLESGIHDILRSMPDRPRGVDQLIAFSLPILEHIDAHRRGNGPPMTQDSRVVMHEHLQDVLTTIIADDLAMLMRRRRAPLQIPADLLARYLSSTFVLVLDWWVESGYSLTPADVDARFRGLVEPILS
jgi:AcrR family transcriptional regulator